MHLVRRAIVGLVRHSTHFRASIRAVLAKIDPAVKIAPGTLLARGCLLEATDGGTIELGRNVWIGRNARLVARGGRIIIGDNSHIGDGVLIAANEMVRIGEDALVAEYVVIRDSEHVVSLNGLKRLAGDRSSRVVIGDDVWVGAKASVLMGSNIGPASVIGAHALVRGQIPAFVVAVGIPARAVKTIDRSETASQHRVTEIKAQTPITHSR